VPYGKEMSAAVYALNFAARAAMTFGGVKPGDLEAARQILFYNKDRVFAFVLALGTDPEAPKDQLLTDQKYATAAGAINYGFPVIADSPIPQILPRGICTYEHVVSNIPLDRIVPKAVEVRGLKLKVSKIPIPIAYGAAFEGERVRKENLHVEFGGKYSTAFEYLRGRPMDQVEDGKVVVIGPDIDKAEPGKAMPLGTVIEVAGRSFHEDFESVLERRIHKFVSCASGIMHIGQRDIPWVRVGTEAYQKGFRLKHLGELLIHKFKDEFSGIVDKIQVTIYTDEVRMQESLKDAREAYFKRDERMAGMKDEDVDRFYSCILCQSYAPNHVCVVTPQRLGLCGAYTWLDCRAAYEMDAHGPNQPIIKGLCEDPVLGIWEGANQYVAKASNGHLQKVTMYSIMQDPQTSCGCFECLVAVLPETNGVMLVNREFQGMTPIGMTFSTMAGEVGGGVQTPGFLGIGRMYIVSEKFISAEGGLQRLVWMPQELKDEMRDRLQARFKETGQPELLDKIATENDATTVDELVEYLQKVDHPAQTMASVLGE
jgi:acetyl-CoA synthase